MEEEDLSQKYSIVKDAIGWNNPIKSLEKSLTDLKIISSDIKECINQRKVEFVIQYGLGYKDNKELHRSFPDAEDSREHLDGTTIVTLSKGNTHKKFYHSKELHIFIKGEPEKRENGLYCLITGNKISE